jgi:hypothetical protein
VVRDIGAVHVEPRDEIVLLHIHTQMTELRRVALGHARTAEVRAVTSRNPFTCPWAGVQFQRYISSPVLRAW